MPSDAFGVGSSSHFTSSAKFGPWPPFFLGGRLDLSSWRFALNSSAAPVASIHSVGVELW
jgi:hypothetical protein